MNVIGWLLFVLGFAYWAHRIISGAVAAEAKTRAQGEGLRELRQARGVRS